MYCTDLLEFAFYSAFFEGGLYTEGTGKRNVALLG